MDATKLTIATPTDCEVVLARVFDASADLVFRALTEPELLKRWYGPTGWEMMVCDIDLRVGGKWRIVSRKPGGKQIGQFGVYSEIVRPTRIVNSEAWEDWDAGETLVTTQLTERDGKTTFESTILFPSKEVRDTVVKSGLEHSAAETYDKLSQLLTEAKR